MEDSRKKKANKSNVPEASTNVTRRKFLKGAGAVGLGAVAMSGGVLQAINAEAKTEKGTIPVGGGVPLTGWAAADGRLLRWGTNTCVARLSGKVHPQRPVRCSPWGN